MDPLTLGLYVLSAGVKRKRDADTLQKSTEAAAAATQAEQAFEIKKIQTEQGLITQRETAKTRADNQTYFMYQNENDPNDVYTAPQTVRMVPEGYKIVGSRVGSASEFTPITDIVGGEGSVGTPLLSYQGRVGTMSELRTQFGPRMDLITLPQVGSINKDGEYNIWSKENRSVALNTRDVQDIIVGERTFALSDAPAAQAYGYEVGIAPKIRTQEVGPNGQKYGSPTFSDVAEVRTTQKDVFNVGIPASGNRPAESIQNLTAPEVDKLLLSRDLRRDDVVITQSRQKIGPKNTVVSEEVVSVTKRADVTETKTLYNASFGGKQYLGLTLEELTKEANDAGYDLTDISYVPVTKKFKNGDLVEESHGTANKPAEQKRHIGYITDRDGVVHQVQAESKNTLDRMYGNMSGYEYAGTANVRMSTDTLIGAVDAVDREDIELTMPDGTNVLMSEATQEQIQNAEQQRPVKVSSDGTIQRTSTSTITPTRTLAESMNIPYRLNGVRYLGAKSSLTPGDTLVSMHGKLDADTLSELNGSEDVAEYVAQVAPVLTQAFVDIKTRPTADGQPQTSPITGFRSAYGFIKQHYGNFLKVEGMEQALIDADTIKLNEQKGDVLNLVVGASSQGSQPIVAESDADPAAMDDSNEVGNLVGRGRDVTLIGSSIPAQYVDFTSNILAPKMMALNGNREDKLNRSMIAFTSYKRDWDGTPIDVDGVMQPTNVQPLLGAMQILNSKQYPGLEETSLDRFISYVNGENVSGLDEEDIRFFANTFIPATTSVRDGVEAIEELIIEHPATLDVFTYTPPSVLDAAKEGGLGGFGSTQTEQQFRADRQVIRSADRGIGIANKILGTYHRPDGTIRQSSAVGEVVLGFEGLEYLGKEAFSALTSALGGTDQAAIADAYMGSLDGFKASIGLETTGSRKDGVAGNTGRSEIETIISDIAADVASAKDADARALAARQFHIVTLAYELSATIQGGTGGRTISDQDVALILKALRQKFLASPESQIAVIQEAREMMREIRTVAEYTTTQDARTRAAFNVVQNLSAMADKGVYHQNISPTSIAARIGGVQPEDVFDDDTLLNTINIQRRLNGQEEYKSIDDVPANERTNIMGMMG